MIWQEMLQSAYFGLLLSLGAFQLARLIAARTRLTILNPLLVSAVLVIGFLYVLDIPYEVYDRGASALTVLLGPATVALAIPLYRQFHLLRRNWPMVVAGVAAGALSAIAGVFALSVLFALSPEVYRSIMTKSITLPIALGVTQEVGGISALTIFAITVTGVLGAVIGPPLCRIAGVKDRVAFGLAMGTAAHAVGTSAALEIGELEGAMSGLAMVVAGLLTVTLAPLAASFM